MKNDDKKTRGKGGAIITRESVGFTLGLFCILLFIMSVTKTLLFGDLGKAVYEFQFGVFGFANYFVLIWFIFVCVRLVIGKNPVPIKRFTLYLTLFLFCLMLTIHAFATAGDATSYGNYLSATFAKGEKGPGGTPFGWVGSLIVFPLRTAITAFGADAILIILTLLFLVLTVRSVLSHFGMNIKIFGKDGIIAAIRNDRERGKKEEPPVVRPQPQKPVKIEQAPETKTSAPFGLPDNTRNVRDVNAREPDFPRKRQSEFSYREEGVDDGESVIKPSYMPPRTEKQEDYSDYDKNIRFLYGARENPEEYRHRNLIFDETSQYNSRTRNANTAQTPVSAGDPTVKSEPQTPPPTYRAANNYNNSVYSEMSSSAMNDVQSPSVQEKKVVDERKEGTGGYSMYHTDVYDTSSSASAKEETERTEPFRREESYRSYDSDRTERRDVFSDRREEPPNERYSGTDDYSVRRGEDRDINSYSDSMEDMSGENAYEQDYSSDTAEDFSREDRRDNFREMFSGESSERSERGVDRTERTERVDRSSLFDDTTEEEDMQDLSETSVPDFNRDRTEELRDTYNTDDRTGNIPSRKQTPPPPKPRVIKEYVRPSLDLLLSYNENATVSDAETAAAQRAIVETLGGFNISVGVKRILSGPVFTRYDINLPRSVDFSKIARYKKEIAMAIHTDTINIYPNYREGSVSIEVPNSNRATVGLKPLLLSPAYTNAKPGSLMFCIGVDAEGKSMVDDLCKMPHMLVAGTTGSGKSVFLHELIVSLIMRYSPEEVRLILIDPKWTEFSVYENLPHLMINEIITDVKKAIVALNWAIAEMEHRYTLFAQMTQKGIAVRNIDEYNEAMEKREDKLPKIVLIADEVADLMMQAKTDVESRIGRIAAKARAAGIHIVLATQRPSVNVITGVLKSNLPSRFALRVSAEVDSRVILDATGAENLLGRGDLLYKTSLMREAKRVQAAWIDTQEINSICEDIRNNNEAYFDDQVAAYINSEGKTSANSETGEGDGKETEAVYIDALRFVVLTGSASISMIQRKCSVGFNKAGKIVEWMEQNGYISPFDGAKSRKVLITKEEFASKFGEL